MARTQRVGRISDPLELYNRPKPEFVARFIRRNKIIAGQLANLSQTRSSVQTSVGMLSGVPSFEVSGVQSGVATMLMTPSEYIDLRQRGGPVAEAAENRITGTVQHVNRIDHVVHVDLRVNDSLDVKLETPLKKITDKGVTLGAEIDMCCKAERATVVLDAA